VCSLELNWKKIKSMEFDDRCTTYASVTCDDRNVMNMSELAIDLIIKKSRFLFSFHSYKKTSSLEPF